MKNQSHDKTWILSIIAGLFILAVSIPGYFTSAESTAQPAVPPPVLPRELQTTGLTAPRLSATQAESIELVVSDSEMTPLPEEKAPALTILDVNASFIRSNDEKLNTPAVPDRIAIPAITLDAPVIAADHRYTEVEGATFGQWLAPSFFAAGWHPDSALLGEMGNTVINGHHNIDGEVFSDLVNVVEGDSILVFSGERSFEYVVTNRMILPETFMDAATRMDNARWLGRSDDERLTLVTCWPLDSYTHRLILVAVPVN